MSDVPKRPPLNLREMSDAELRQESARRARARAERRRPAPQSAYATPAQLSHPEQILQYYVNLELEPGASVAEIELAYRSLQKRYNPEKHVGDPEKHRAAERLMASLTSARDALLEYKKSRRS